MSGQLVGEVLAARADYLADLTPAQTLALVAIANRCAPATRQCWIANAEIQTVIGQSQRTTERTLGLMRERGVIRMVKRGYKTHGVTRAPVYELALLPPPKMAGADDGAPATQVGESNTTCSRQNSNLLPPKRQLAPATLGGGLNVLTNVLTNEGEGGAFPDLRLVPAVPDHGNALSPLNDLPDNNHDDPEPPEFCAAHMPHGTSTSCRVCKVARINHERWDGRQAARWIVEMRARSSEPPPPKRDLDAIADVIESEPDSDAPVCYTDGCDKTATVVGQCGYHAAHARQASR
jgi:hypothetical protein